MGLLFGVACPVLAQGVTAARLAGTWTTPGPDNAGGVAYSRTLLPNDIWTEVRTKDGQVDGRACGSSTFAGDSIVWTLLSPYDNGKDFSIPFGVSKVAAEGSRPVFDHSTGVGTARR